MRFSLRLLFCLVTFSAVACLSLFYASKAISSAMAAAFWLAVIVAIIGSGFGRGADRAFFGGFAIMGLSYIASSCVESSTIPNPTNFIRIPLSKLYKSVEREVYFDAETWQSNPDLEREGGEWKKVAINVWSLKRPPEMYFALAGEVIVAFVLSVAGGGFACWCYRRPPSRTTNIPSLP